MNNEVTLFLDSLNHILRDEIEILRQIILDSASKLSENIKWNGPNYCYDGEDRITMKIHPPKQIQIIFHRGVKVLEQPKNRLINDDSNLLAWKTNDRAVATFKNMADITSNKSAFTKIVSEWVNAAS
ncbi:MAG TPA: DUF1801 domain-containing protein [Pyrinomonadaceae bacterium]|nr:DUF1801 domain-containing protein [Pyrinomonadaceae bacterium]